MFTYGWERADVAIPPGSTTVEIDLTATAEASDVVRLVHRGLDDLAAGAHAGGWTHYLDRLRRRAEGSILGTDPFGDSARADTSGASPMSGPMLRGEARFWDLAAPLLGAAGCDVVRR